MLLVSLACAVAPPERPDRGRNAADTLLSEGVCPEYSGLHTNDTHFVQSIPGYLHFETRVAGVTGDVSAPIVEVEAHERQAEPASWERTCDGTWTLRCDADGLWLLASSFDCRDVDGVAPGTTRWVTTADWKTGFLLIGARSENRFGGEVAPTWTMSWSRDHGVGTDQREEVSGATEVTGYFEAGTGSTAALAGADVPVRHSWRPNHDPLTRSHSIEGDGVAPSFSATGWWAAKSQHPEYGPFVVDPAPTLVSTVSFTP